MAEPADVRVGTKWIYHTADGYHARVIVRMLSPSNEYRALIQWWREPSQWRWADFDKLHPIPTDLDPSHPNYQPPDPTALLLVLSDFAEENGNSEIADAARLGAVESQRREEHQAEASAEIDFLRVAAAIRSID